MGVDHRAVFMMLAIVGPMTMIGSASASADQIYKSVDKAGKVTYSAAPLADAVTTKMVEPPHQPTPEQVSAAEEQYQLVKTLGAELEKNRKQREEEQAHKMAEERAQQNTSQFVVVYWPVSVFAGPIRPLSHHRAQVRFKRESRGQREQPRLARREISRPRPF
ncbi:MAG: DUF4124 domain-containing protein [Sulfuricaulis sp.]|uniref:DUF4124 domain-containing protein n=1 Tax=Sulfuricaulis sp. TaxID=2003553 RepID=UPI003C3352C7